MFSPAGVFHTSRIWRKIKKKKLKKNLQIQRKCDQKNCLCLSLFAFTVNHQETILTEDHLQRITMQRTDRVGEVLCNPL